MKFRNLACLLAPMACLMALPTTAQAQDPDEVVVTGVNVVERRDEERVREAIAYANPMPRGAPTGSDYAFVAWCDALVSGHVALGESLNSTDDLDLELIRLGKLEAADFRSALLTGRPRQSPTALAEADAATTAVRAEWANYDDKPLEVRNEAFGLFLGLPGRCEHAARRVRANITTPPVTPEEVGLEMPEAPAAAAPAPEPADPAN